MKIILSNMYINFDVITMRTYMLKIFFISMCTYFMALKITNKNDREYKKAILLNISFMLNTVIVSIIKYNTNSFIGIISLIILMSFYYCYRYKNNIGYSIMIMTISLSVNYIVFTFSAVVAFFVNLYIPIRNDYISLLLIASIDLIILKFLLKLKKFKYGIAVLQENENKEYFDIPILNICVIILFSVIILANINISISKSLFIGLIIFSIIMFITIQKSLQLYYKQKMLIKELDETKEDLARTENKIKILEKENIEESKKRHTIIHKQKSIEYKLEEMLTKTEMSTEEAAEVRERLEKLNKEIYTEKEVMELDKTGISSIDDMLKYMQSECIKNKIDFTLQIKGNIHYMVHNLVKEEELETLLADHIKDAIIAINHTDNANRSILVRLGNIDDIYSLYIYDSGVEFKPEVLESLGKKPCTTYASEGGTGMGFMNTFDTVRKHKASLIIEEIGKPVKDNYTKVIIIKFDKKNEFKVKSYHEIEKV